MRHSSGSAPIPTFTTISSVAVVVGIVVGTGIFSLPPIVAGNSANGIQFIAFWIAGGLISLLGALCYAELASSRPNVGGEYHFLYKAFGPFISFLFTWGRMTVIQTGSIALVAFILGDYASLILNLGKYSSAIYAASAVILLTGLNIMGTKHSRKTQLVFTSLIVLILVVISVSGIVTVVPAETNGSWGEGAIFSVSGAGLAMIFVLLTYGGWNEAAYLSGELLNVRKNMIKVLVSGILIITALYVLVNIAYLHVLGFEKLQASTTAGADLTGEIFGRAGSLVVAFIVIFSALSTANATIITGARTNYALGRDFSLFSFLGRWNSSKNSPVNALLLQGIIALFLIFIGAWSEGTISTMVDYTAPVFWFFLMLTTLTLFIFRMKNGASELPYKVPLYPVTPILFLIACISLLYSSLAYTGIGALIGSAFLIAGIPVYYFGLIYKRK